MISNLRFCVVVFGVFLVASVLSVGYILYQVIYFPFLLPIISQSRKYSKKFVDEKKKKIIQKCDKLNHKRSFVWIYLFIIFIASYYYVELFAN